MINKLIISVLFAALVGCASQSEQASDSGEDGLSTLDTPPRLTVETHCQSAMVLLDARFEAGQLGECEVTGEFSFELTLYPEDHPPINPSPWYALRINTEPGSEVALTLRVEGGSNRYWPKVSVDGINWQSMGADQVVFSEDKSELNVTITAAGAQTWLAAQEIRADAFFTGWNQSLAAHEFTTTRLAGSSAGGRPVLVTETADRPEYLLVVGRQHPPEVTGTLTMQPFVDVLLGDTELARAFRDRYKLVIYPVLNPDGVAAGHWRHTTGGVDLNRDWGPFSQPESILVRDHVDELLEQGMQPRLMLDFHSTQKNVFYTQLESEPTEPVGFATRWMDSARDRLPDYEFEHDARAVSERPTTKNYFYKRFGIPSITYETGDETDRKEMNESVVIFAEEMMRLMLEYQP